MAMQSMRSIQKLLLPSGVQSNTHSLFCVRFNSSSASIKGTNRAVASSQNRSVNTSLTVSGFSKGFSMDKKFSQGRNYAPSTFNIEEMHTRKPRRKEPLLGPSRARAEQTDTLFKAGLRPGHVSLHDDSYKNPVLLSSYVTEMGKIMPRRLTGLTRRSQREVAKAIRRAQSMGLMPVMSKNTFRAWSR